MNVILFLLALAVSSIMTEKTPLALPYKPQEGADPSELTVGGSVTLDHLGPIVVGVDGSMQRITNWDTLTEAERKNTMRVVAKRNKQRLEQLALAEVAVDPQGDLLSALESKE